jgi:DNA-binding HxlR family transcriptional regulator
MSMSTTPAEPDPSSRRATAARMVEDILGCKWSLAILGRIRAGVSRPGAIRRSLPGLSTKVMNERLAKMLRYGLLARQRYDERKPRVEYELTPLGEQLAAILDQVESLQARLDADGGLTASPR